MPVNKALGKFRSRIHHIGSGFYLLSVLLFFCFHHSPCSGRLTLFLVLNHRASIPASGLLPGALISMGSSWLFVLKSQLLPPLDVFADCPKGPSLPSPVPLLHVALLYFLPGGCHTYMKCFCSRTGSLVCFVSLPTRT